MTTPNKRRSLATHLSVEEQALNMITKEAENREATSHAELAEARKIRTHELERIRKEQGPDGDESAETSEVKEIKDSKDVKNTNVPVVNDLVRSRSITEEMPIDAAHLKLKLEELEVKYKKVMMSNAQMDNEKQTTQYQIELLKDQIGDMEEEQIELKRQLHHKNQDLSLKTVGFNKATSKCQQLEAELRQRDDLIKANGLVLVSVAEATANGERTNPAGDKVSDLSSVMLLSNESLQSLSQLEGDSLGEKIQKFHDEKLTLIAENKRLQHELEMEKSRFALAQKYPIANEAGASPVPSASTPDGILVDAETQKNVTEYKLKLKKAEQEITTLQGTVTRLESQVNRYKQAAENSEKAEEELKVEKRRLQKELREVQVRVEDLESQNSHLQKRLEKSKTAKT